MEERISEIEDQLNEIKHEDKIREKRIKRSKQSLQQMWGYVKRPNRCFIGVPESDGENGTKMETRRYYLGEFPQPNKKGQHSNLRNTEKPQTYSSRRATPRYVIVRFTRVEMKEKVLRAARERSGYPQMEAHQTNSGSLCKNPMSQKRVGANIQHS